MCVPWLEGSLLQWGSKTWAIPLWSVIPFHGGGTFSSQGPQQGVSHNISPLHWQELSYSPAQMQGENRLIASGLAASQPYLSTKKEGALSLIKQVNVSPPACIRTKLQIHTLSGGSTIVNYGLQTQKSFVSENPNYAKLKWGNTLKFLYSTSAFLTSVN